MEKKVEIDTWLSDKLISILGYSKPIIIKYVMGLSKLAASPETLASRLTDVGLSLSTDTITFAEEVFHRLTPKAPRGLNPYQRDEIEKILFVRKQRSFKIIQVEEDEDTSKIEYLRRASRQEYLKKREKKKIEELLDEIEDERHLFDEISVSEKEKTNLKKKEELYAIVRKRAREDDMDEAEGYIFPEAYDRQGRIDQKRRFSVAKDKYRDEREEHTNWEDSQLKNAKFRFGAKNRKLVIYIRNERLSKG